jgi:hypothetical protein
MRKAIAAREDRKERDGMGEWAVLCRDLAKACDTVPRQELWAMSKAFKYPRWIFRLSLNHYEGKRYMLFDHGLVGPAWTVAKGICPGSTAATRELKLVLMAGLLRMRQEVPQASITVHADDYRIELSGRHNEEVITAAEQLDAKMKKEWTRLGMQQAPDKQELYATNTSRSGWAG